jgi:GGDEF domain-containing protein
VDVDELAVLRVVTDAIVDDVLLLDAAGDVRWRRNGSRLRAAGTGDEPPLLERVHPDDLPGVLDALDRIREGLDHDVILSARIADPRKPDVLHDEDLRAIDARSVAGIDGVLVLLRRVDSRRAFREQVHGDDFSLADAAPVGLAVIAASGKLLFANDRFRDQLGVGSRGSISPTGVDGLQELVAETRADGNAEELVLHRGRMLRVVGRRIGDVGGSIALSVADVTGETTHDEDTGLPNRTLLDEHVQLAILRSDRRDDRAAVLVIEVGDEDVLGAAHHITGTCRGADVVARIGERTFVVVADPTGTQPDGRRLAERLLATGLRARIGITPVSPVDSADSVLHRAADACAQAGDRPVFAPAP